MLFNSLTFLLFFPVVTAGYYLLRANVRFQNVWLLAASLFFYACWDWRFVFLLLLTVVVDFYVAQHLDRMYERGDPPERRKWFVAISMGANLAILGFFKYFNFFVESVHAGFQALGWDPPLGTLSIILPVGISFYTFQSMSYTIDVYRRELPAAKSILDFTLFVSFYPHLVAGPIMRAVDLLPQILRPRRTTRDQVIDGLHLIVWGFWKKVFVADNLAPVVNRMFALPNPTGFETAMGVYAFAFQIYCDFSGYTDIARGIAKLMGFELVLNFNLPYFATNPKEFWTRWHISLSSWLRNYLYIPLGGNRGSEGKTYRNLMLTMVLGGLWHGAAWNFVLWGFYQGGLLVVHRLSEPFLDRVFKAETAWGRGVSFAVRVLFMFQVTCYGWLLFRATSMSQIVGMTRSLLVGPWTWDAALFSEVLLFAFPLIAIQTVQYCSGNLYFLRFRWVPAELRAACYAALAYLAVFRAAKPQSFIYFQF
jgi:D-alanyl-lipoteichoic acid acyltransferase DltB (MBOAT superfamily)